VALSLLVCREYAVKHLLIRRTGFMQDSGINRCCQQIVCRRNGMDIASKMKVKVLHWDHLAVPSTGSPALDAKGGSLAGLADTGHHPLAKMCTQRLAESHGGGCLTFTQRSGGDGGHINVLAIRNIRKAVQHFQFHFRLGGTVHFDFIRKQSQLLRHLGDGLDIRFLGNINIGWHR